MNAFIYTIYETMNHYIQERNRKSHKAFYTWQIYSNYEKISVPAQAILKT